MAHDAPKSGIFVGLNKGHIVMALKWILKELKDLQQDPPIPHAALVANKLYQLSYISEIIEKFATNMLLSAVEQSPSGTEHAQSGPTGQRAKRMAQFKQLESVQ